MLTRLIVTNTNPGPSALLAGTDIKVQAMPSIVIVSPTFAGFIVEAFVVVETFVVDKVLELRLLCPYRYVTRISTKIIYANDGRDLLICHLPGNLLC